MLIINCDIYFLNFKKKNGITTLEFRLVINYYSLETKESPFYVVYTFINF